MRFRKAEAAIVSTRRLLWVRRESGVVARDVWWWLVAGHVVARDVWWWLCHYPASDPPRGSRVIRRLVTVD